MKILHLPSTFLPAHTGGKEVFVYQLIANYPLGEDEHIVVVHDREKTTYEYKGVRVYTLPPAITHDSRHSYFSGVYDELPGFEELLTELQPDVVHFHDQGNGASLSHLRVCKTKNISTLLTYHSPGQSCMQRALLHNGTEPCNGRIDLTRCTACRYVIQGVPSIAAHLASHIHLSKVDRDGRWMLRNSTELYYQSWREFYDIIDAIQVHAYWVKELLLLNGIAEKKIHYVAMGGHATEGAVNEKQWTGRPLRFVFSGRCTDIKGVHLLVQAVKELPADVPIEIYFFGSWPDTDYCNSLRSQMVNDSRFKTPRLIEPSQILSELKTMDICVIPSLWPETGPFTVFDAFAAGLPVIGSDLAGLRERVSDEVNGLLFKWGDPHDLSGKINRIVSDPSLGKKLQSGIKPNRTHQQFSADIRNLYQRIAAVKK